MANNEVSDTMRPDTKADAEMNRRIRQHAIAVDILKNLMPGALLTMAEAMALADARLKREQSVGCGDA